MLSKNLNLALVDDHAIFRKTLKSFLSDQENMYVALQASNMSDLLPALKTSSIDILLMDVFLPEPIGGETIKTIHEEFPDVKILILSISMDMDLVSDLLDAGIHGFMCKADEPEELLQAIRAVANDQIYRNRLVTEAMYWSKQNKFRSFMSVSPITLNDREKKMLQLIWEEKNNKEIAEELFLGVRSVEKIRQDMKEKLNVRSTVGLLKYAISKGIIKSGSKSPDLIR